MLTSRNNWSFLTRGPSMNKLSRFMQSWLRLAVLAATVFLGAPRAEAGYLLPFTGNTFPVDSVPGVDGHVNFTVLDHTGGVAGDSFGTGVAGFDTHFTPGLGSGGLDTTARFLYLFQTVNDGSNTLPISVNSVQAADAFVTSHGEWTTGGTLGFTNAGIPTIAGGPYLGAGGASAAPGDPSPALTGGMPGIASVPGLVGPAFTTSSGSTSIAANFNPALGARFTSAIWGYTSNIVPIFSETSIQDGGTSALGMVPSASIPEPSSIVLAGIGGLGLICFVIRGRRGA
jgi:hypothetical protein